MYATDLPFYDNFREIIPLCKHKSPKEKGNFPESLKSLISRGLCQ